MISTDFTSALKWALCHPNTVTYIPPGRYILNQSSLLSGEPEDAKPALGPNAELPEGWTITKTLLGMRCDTKFIWIKGPSGEEHTGFGETWTEAIKSAVSKTGA